MSSPQKLPFSQFIKIDRRKSDPVYLQIAYQFIRAVQVRILEDGEQIPGTRELSKELRVHRKTVVKAIEELQLQGWLRTVPSVGSYAINPMLRKDQKKRNGFQTLFLERANFPYRRSFVLDIPNEQENSTLQFTEGTSDYRIIKAEEIGRFYSSVIKRKIRLKGNGIPTYSSFFREQLSFYLNTTRGFHGSVDNLLSTKSKSTLLYILAQLLVETGDTVLVGEYSYPFANMILQQAGARLHTIPMDQYGIRTGFIREHFQTGDIKLLYLQPEHHYPTTVCLSEKRRHELIQLSKELDFMIVEDEPFFELTYETSMRLPLIKRNHEGKVIYIGNFGRYLLPGFNVHFLLGPVDFIREAQKYLAIFNELDPLKERALGEMIYEGDIHRFRRKALRVYESRRDHFDWLLQNQLPSVFKYRKPIGGLAFWLSVNPGTSLSEISRNCREEGLLIPRICLFQNGQYASLRLGFGHLNEKEMQDAIQRFRRGIERIQTL